MIRSTNWTTIVDFGRSSTIGGALTMKQAMAKAITDASYHAGCGHRDVTILLREHCGRCSDSGCVYVVKRGRKHVAPCPDCKGDSEVSTIGPVPFVLHPNLVADIQSPA